MLSEGSVRDGDEKEPLMEEDPGDPEVLRGYQWLLRDLPRLPLFDSVRPTTALALQQVGVRGAAGGTAGSRALACGWSSHGPPSPGHPHGDRPTDRQRLPGLSVPAHARGGAEPAQ